MGGKLCTSCDQIFMGRHSDGGSLSHPLKFYISNKPPSCSICKLVVEMLRQKISTRPKQFLRTLSYGAEYPPYPGYYFIVQFDPTLEYRDQEGRSSISCHDFLGFFQIEFVAQGSLGGRIAQKILGPRYTGTHIRKPITIFRDIRKSSHVCENEHGVQCNPVAGSHRPNPVSLVLIDVVQYRLVKTDQNRDPLRIGRQKVPRYIALSYVWGSQHGFQTTKNTFLELSKVGALARMKKFILRSIRDAMKMVRILGERYLWVDRLCIVQDDELNKHLQISQMDLIYSHAFMTVALAFAQDANSPIPGISIDFSKSTTKIIQGYQFSVQQPDLGEALSNSYYRTRAWTMQEYMLSNRCLFVFAHQTYFRCRRAVDRGIMINRTRRDDVNWRDELDHTAGGDGISRLLVRPSVDLPSDSWKLDFGPYAEIVTEYTEKTLSYSADILNAFSGICGVFTQLGKGKFSCGLPLLAFKSALLWRPYGAIKRRILKSTNIKAREFQFPSWSWAGWEGQVGYDLKFSALDGPERSFGLAEVDFCIRSLVIHDKIGYYSVSGVDSENPSQLPAWAPGCEEIQGHAQLSIRRYAREHLYPADAFVLKQRPQQWPLAWQSTGVGKTQQLSSESAIIIIETLVITTDAFSIHEDHSRYRRLGQDKSKRPISYLTRRGRTVDPHFQGILFWNNTNFPLIDFYNRHCDYCFVLLAATASQKGNIPIIFDSSNSDPRMDIVVVLLARVKGQFAERAALGLIYTEAFENCSPELRRISLI